MDWVEYRKVEIEKVCRECTKEYEYKVYCVYKHSMSFGESKFPCRHMEGKREWGKKK